MLAVWLDDWSILNTSQDSAESRQKTFESNLRPANSIAKKILENPRKPMRGIGGTVHVPDLPYNEVLKWALAVRDQELIIIDPISMIDYADREMNEQQWEGQQRFIKQMSGVARFTNTHIMLVCHTRKRVQGRHKVLELDDVQGAADLTRFAHNVFLLDFHEERESEVKSMTSHHVTVRHKRTLSIGKTRSGPGTGVRFAYDFRHGAQFCEFGIILPKKKGE
jgi:hypothetical protein